MKRTGTTLNDTTQSNERFRNFERAEEAELKKTMSNIFSDEKSRPQQDMGVGIVAPGGPFSETDDLFSREDNDEGNMMRMTSGPNDIANVETVIKQLTFAPSITHQIIVPPQNKVVKI